MKFSADEFAKYGVSIVAAAYTDASTDGASFDCKGFTEVLVIFDAALAAANAEGDVHIEDSADDSTFADLAGAVFTQVTPSNDVTWYVGRINPQNCKRYIRAVLATDGSNAMSCSIGFIGLAPKYGPAAQTNSTVFDV